MRDQNIVSFVYGNEPMACEVHDNCPMRFRDEEARVKHYEEADALKMEVVVEEKSDDVKMFQCLSCARANKTVLFHTKRELNDHKTNPRVICSEE